MASLNDIPANWKLPLFWLTVDGSQAGLSTQKEPALLTGHMLAPGVAALGVPIAVGSAANAAALFGYGSMLHRMAVIFFAISPYHEVWMMAVAAPAAGVAATGGITVSAAATAPGTIALYIAGQNVSIAANGTDTPAQIATKIVAAINALTSLPVVAAVDGSNTAKVDLTCRWVGASGNDISVMDSYYGALGGEQLPTGLALTYTAMAGGTGTPDFSTCIGNLGDDEYDYVAQPFTDTVSLGLWETEYGFSSSGRWGWNRQLYGAIWSARRDTYSNLMTFGPTRNSPVTSIMTVEPQAPSPVWEWSAAYAAIAADALLDDPARPLQTLEMSGILPAQRQYRFNQNQKNALATTGLAIQAVAPSGNPMILREQSCYQVNSYGQSDDAYELMTTQYTNARLFRRMKSAITSKYPRSKLADDGTKFGIGQAIVTPSDIKGEILSEYTGAITDGLAENYTAFKNALSVTRDPDTPTRINVVFPPDLVNGLRTFAVLAQFRLQFGRGAS